VLDQSQRQHGTLSLLCVFFSPCEAKKRGCPLGDKELKITRKRNSYCCSFFALRAKKEQQKEDKVPL
jgi:hypothetical protein